MKKLIFYSLLTALVACTQNETEKVPVAKIKTKLDDFVGTYVSDGFDKRDSGYDWVSVDISKVFDSVYFVAIRSRTDIKKATCTYFSEVRLMPNGKLLGHHKDYSLEIIKNNSTIEIIGVNDMPLNYFCSGGGSLKGTYTKTEIPLPDKQLAKERFSTNLYNDQYFFEINQINNDLKINPRGLSVSNVAIKQLEKGQVIDAEMGDLDVDGYPELYIYVRKEKGGLDLIAYNINKGKSLSMIATPSDFYAKTGLVEMALVENNLVRRIKTEQGTVQFQYKLYPGEALPQLKLDKTVKY